VKPLSTEEIASVIDIHRVTLEKWLRNGKVKQPKRLHVGGRVVRLWSMKDVKRLRKYKRENYRKGRGRKPKPRPIGN
jgi:predicted site-specific integrase-resolvase